MLYLILLVSLLELFILLSIVYMLKAIIAEFKVQLTHKAKKLHDLIERINHR